MDQSQYMRLKNEASQMARVTDEVNSQLGRINSSKAAIDEQLVSLRSQVSHIQANWQGAGAQGFNALAERWQGAANQANSALDEWKMRASELNSALSELQKKAESMNAALDNWTQKTDQLNGVLQETGQALDRVAAEYSDLDRRIGGAFNG